MSLKTVMFKKLARTSLSSLAGGTALLLLFVQVRAAFALQMKLEFGFEGQYRIQTWTPLRITFENQESSIEGTLLIKLARKDFLEQKSAEIIYSFPVSFPPFSRKLYQINVLLESDAHLLEVLLIAGESTLLKREIQIEPIYEKEGFILVVNRAHSGFNFLSPARTKKIRRVLYADLDELPHEWIGYDAIQTLILDDITSIELTSAQQRAIKLWLSTGGTLIVTARGGYGKFKSPFLLDLLPLKFLRKIYLDSSLSSLQDKYGAFKGDPQRVELWKGQWGEGDILVKEGDIPLVVRLKRGQGRIFFLAFDFTQPPFGNWSGMFHLWAEMIKNEKIFPLFFRGILDPFLARPPSWTGWLYLGRGKLALYLLAYLVVLGFFSRQLKRGRSLRRAGMGLAFIIATFIGISFLAGVKMQEGNITLREISIFYKGQDGSLARAESYLGLFSPCSRLIELRLDEKSCFPAAILAPEKERLFKDLMVFPEEGKIRWSSSPSPPWSFHLFRLETILPFPLQAGLKEGKNVRVRLENSNSFPLEDLLLLYNGHSSFLKGLPPLSEIELTLNLRGKNFSSSAYLEEIMLRGPDPEARLRGEIFQGIWDSEGPLRKTSAEFPVLLAWFKSSPPIAVRANYRIKHCFTGLLIMPLRAF